MSYALLSNRRIVQLNGNDTLMFLQNLTTNSMLPLKDNHNICIYTAFLNPQGKFLTDAFVFRSATEKNVFYVDIEKENSDIFMNKLEIYKLKSQVSFSFLDHIFTYVGQVEPSMNSSLFFEATQKDFSIGFFKDPRLPLLGYRSYTTHQFDTSKEVHAPYVKTRLSHLIPDAAVIPYQKGFIMEYGFEHLNAIDFNKGCYLGQELTASMYYKKLGKRTLGYFEIPKTLAAQIHPIQTGDLLSIQEEPAGRILECYENCVLAHMLKEPLQKQNNRTTHDHFQTVHFLTQSFSLHHFDQYVRTFEADMQIKIRAN